MMHVDALMQFSPPARSSMKLLRQLMDEMRQQARAYPPWNLKLKHPKLLSSPLQRWVEDDDFDVEYHVRRSARPSPGDERELGILVSRLHSHNIDFHRPPWEVHFIERLEGGRFALYFKVHHALVDGYTGIRLLSAGLSGKASDKHTPMFFAQQPSARKLNHEDGTTATRETQLTRVREQFGVARLKQAAKAQSGTLNFGYIGCRDTLPHLQHLAVYSREALEELEALTAA